MQALLFFALVLLEESP